VPDADELLGDSRPEVRERVHAEIGEELKGARAFDKDLDHVVRLVEESTRLTPRPLLGPPVAELRCDRERVRKERRVSQQLDGASRSADGLFQALGAHRGRDLPVAEPFEMIPGDPKSHNTSHD
jgi:hypothetical protein